MSSPRPDAPLPAPIGTPAEGEKLVNHMLDVMDALLATVEEETQLVRDGNLAEATKLEAVKSELSTLYVTSIKDSGTGRMVGTRPASGKVMAISGLGTRGVPEPRFVGL